MLIDNRFCSLFFTVISKSFFLLYGFENAFFVDFSKRWVGQKNTKKSYHHATTNYSAFVWARVFLFEFFLLCFFFVSKCVFFGFFSFFFLRFHKGQGCKITKHFTTLTCRRANKGRTKKKF